MPFCSATPQYLAASEEQLLEWQHQGRLVLTTTALGSTYAISRAEVQAVQVRPGHFLRPRLPATPATLSP
jgi:hypothetical protein